jgi:hypothetical protein
MCVYTIDIPTAVWLWAQPDQTVVAIQFPFVPSLSLIYTLTNMFENIVEDQFILSLIIIVPLTTAF